MNVLRMVGWELDRLFLFRGTEWVLLVFGGFIWCFRKGCKIKFLKGIFKLIISFLNGGG